MRMTGSTSVSALFVVFALAGSLNLAEAKNWRYWSNIGCYRFNFQRTVFFELTDAATSLASEGSQLSAVVNTSLIPTPNTPDQIQHFISGSIKDSNTNTPEECITSCNSTGYQYAAMQDGKTCVCANEQPLDKVSASDCNTACSGNANFSCGGSWVMDVHQNPAYHSSGLTYIGCFKNTFNDLDRMLFEGTYNNFQNNTPEWCVTYCTAGGYDYAGLQYSSQCICSNSGPQGNSDESQCSYACAGDSSITTCGGLGYINIFHTDAHKSTIDEFGCGNTAQDTYYQRWFEDMGHCNISTTPSSAPSTKSKRDMVKPDGLPEARIFLLGDEYDGSSRKWKDADSGFECDLGRDTTFDNTTQSFHVGLPKPTLITCDYDLSPSKNSELTIEILFKLDDDYKSHGKGGNNMGWLVNQEKGGDWSRSVIVGDGRFKGMGHGIGGNYISTTDYPSVGEWHHAIATYRQGVNEGSFIALDGVVGNKVKANNRDGTPTFSIGGISTPVFDDWGSHNAKGLVRALRIYETAFDENAVRLAYESMRDNLL